MLLSQLFRSFVPLRNPIGFGASDFIELAFTLLLVVPALAWRPWIETYAARLAPRTGWCMLALAASKVRHQLRRDFRYSTPILQTPALARRLRGPTFRR